MNKVIRCLFIAVGILLAGQVYAADVYTIDQAHSTIGFSVKHMMVSNVPGQFNQFDGTIAYAADDLVNSKITVNIPVAGINTNNDKRDGHLKSPDFFDAAQFPTITFVSKSITATAIVGDLTVKGVTKEVSIPATITGPVKAMGKELIGINGTFTLNRQDYGITYNKVLDQGGVAVSNDVNVNISIEADKK